MLAQLGPLPARSCQALHRSAVQHGTGCRPPPHHMAWPAPAARQRRPSLLRLRRAATKLNCLQLCAGAPRLGLPKMSQLRTCAAEPAGQAHLHESRHAAAAREWEPGPGATVAQVAHRRLGQYC